MSSHLTVILPGLIIALVGRRPEDLVARTPKEEFFTQQPPGATVNIEIAVPEEWTPGQALAMRQLLQHAVQTGQPVISFVKKDVTPEQLKDICDRVDAFIREAGLEPV